MSEEKVIAKIGGKDYELVLNVYALEAILEKFDCDLDQLGEQLSKALKSDNPITLVAWLITLLANQSIEINNELNDTKEPLLTEKRVKVLTDFAGFIELEKLAVNAITLGLKQFVQSENEVKNAAGE